MSNDVANQSAGSQLPSSQAIENLLIKGDLSGLTVEQRVAYYKNVCQSLGLNYLTQPFNYLTFQGRMALYAKKDCTDQLRRIYKINITIKSKEVIEGIYVVTAQASTPDGRVDEDCGAVVILGLKGDALANATMKALTKAKRRVTLSICGLGTLDESEIDSIPGAKIVEIDLNSKDPTGATPPPASKGIATAYTKEEYAERDGLMKQIKSLMVELKIGHENLQETCHKVGIGPETIANLKNPNLKRVLKLLEDEKYNRENPPAQEHDAVDPEWLKEAQGTFVGGVR